SLRLGKQIPDAEVVGSLQSQGGDASVIETWKRTAEHLEANSIKSYSIWMGRPLQLDSVAEVFAGNDAPNQWLSREYRAPYSLPSEQAV
ncbi:MAG: hypothetical protein ACKN85_14890, partial [Pirellula sp.]